MQRAQVLATRVFVALALLVADGAALTAPARAQSDAQQGCQSLYQRRNRDHCRQQINRGEWPCSALPVQDLQDLKNCAELFDPTLFSPKERAGAATQALPRTESAPEPTETIPLGVAGRETVPSSSGQATESVGEVLPLRMIDMEIATAKAAQDAALERRRSLEAERARVVRRLGAGSERTGPPPEAKGEVLELYRELERLQTESDRLTQEIRAQDAALQEARKRREAVDSERVEAAAPAPARTSGLGVVALGMGALLLAAIAGGLVMWRRKLHLPLDRTRIFASAAVRAPPGGAAVPDCTLVGGEGMSFLLMGSLLSRGGIVVGRHSGQVQVVIDRPEVSRRHARFSMQNGVLSLEDLGSANGTLVDGVRVRAGERRTLANGAQVQFGPYQFTMRVGG